MPSGLSGLSRIVEGVKRLVLRRELVGVDSLGNKYFRKAEVLNGRPFERRWVSPVRGEYDPGSIPPEWTSWLHKGRADPPQEEESMRLEASRLAMQKKVEALEEEERKRKFRMESLRLQGQQADSEPSMTRFVEQLATKGYGGSGNSSGVSPDASGEQPARPKPGSSDTKFEAETWKPG